MYEQDKASTKSVCTRRDAQESWGVGGKKSAKTGERERQPGVGVGVLFSQSGSPREETSLSPGVPLLDSSTLLRAARELIFLTRETLHHRLLIGLFIY